MCTAHVPQAQRLRYKHMDLADLEAKLVEARGARLRLVATDGVFSMDGDIAPLADIVVLARKHKALVFVGGCCALRRAVPCCAGLFRAGTVLKRGRCAAWGGGGAPWGERGRGAVRADMPLWCRTAGAKLDRH